MRFILLGFPKSGTSSFQKLFHKLGLESVHHYCACGTIGGKVEKNKKAGRKLLDGLEHVSITQLDCCLASGANYWPQITDRERLYEENKDAVFILNKRDIDSLLSSFKRWGNLDDRLLNFNPDFFREYEGTRDEKVKAFMANHYRETEEFFASKEEARFITYDINKDSLSKLSPFIDLRNISVLPHENKNTRFRGDV